MIPAKRLSRWPLIWLISCVLISLVVLIYPIYVIRPFRHQGARELAVALAVMRFRPFFEIALVIAALMLLVICWRQARNGWAKATASVCALLIFSFAALSRVNIYELMFHPLDNPTFSAGSTAKFDGGEEVIAVRIGRAARAYPVRIMSYHHIVNDVVGGTPIVATY